MIPAIPMIPVVPLCSVDNSEKSGSFIILVEMFVFIDYQKLVLEAYQEKDAAGTLHAYLARPTPARLRDRCVSVYSDGYSRKDEQTIRTFFGKSDEKGSYLKAIEGGDIDRFRPLIKFLKDPSIKTEEKNVELLAWLIDFQPRPFDIAKGYYSSNSEEKNPKIPINPIIPGHIPDLIQPSQSSSGPQKPISKARSHNTKVWRGIAIVILLSISLGGIIYRRTGKTENTLPVLKSPSPGAQACMFWAGERYQPISCQKHGDTLVVALDPEMLNGFKKITNWDTVTEKSIGKIWFIKINKSLELYTIDGPYPTDPTRRLRQLSEHMYKTWVHPGQ